MKITIRHFLSILFLQTLIGCTSTSLTNNNSASTIETKKFEVITIALPSSAPIEGLLFKPEGSGPFPAVVALHGCAGLYTKNHDVRPRDLEWGQRLAAHGIVAIFPDSFTTRNIKEICSRSGIIDFTHTTRSRDAYATLEWLQHQPYISPDRIALMGWSNGGSALLTTISNSPSMPPSEIKSDFKIAVAFYPGCYATKKNKKWTNRIPLQIHIGELDNWTSPKDCEALKKRSQSITVIKYPESYHDFDSPNLPLKKHSNLAYVIGKDHSAFTGTNEAARNKSVQSILSLFKKELTSSD